MTPSDQTNEMGNSMEVRSDLLGAWLTGHLPCPQFRDHLEELGIDLERVIYHELNAFPFRLIDVLRLDTNNVGDRAAFWMAIVDVYHLAKAKRL